MRWWLIWLILMAGGPVHQAFANSDVSRVTVTLVPAGELLEARFQLPSKRERFEFFADPMPASQRLADWVPLGDGWAFDGLRLMRADGSAFDRFRFRLPPAKALHDRHYVPLSRVGKDGWVIFADIFAPLGADHELRIAGADPEMVLLGDGSVHATDQIFFGPELGIFYLGPRRYLTEQAGVLVAGSEIPSSLQQDITRHLDYAVSKLSQAWGMEPTSPPTVMITSDPAWPGRSQKGGVLDEVVTFHFRGLDLGQMGPRFASGIRNTAIHEAVHLWNGSIFQSTENAEQSWVHEGAAEYIANRLWMDEPSFAAAAGSALNGCFLALGSESIMNTQVASRGRTPYLCGHLVHWAAELASIAHAQGNVLELWRSIYAATGEDRTYDSGLFLEQAELMGGAEFVNWFDLLEDGLDEPDRHRLVAWLNALGATIAPLAPGASESGGDEIASAMVLRILASRCQGRYGFHHEEGQLRLDTGDRCGEVLAGDPVIDSINGLALASDPGSLIASVRQRCTEQQQVALGRADGRPMKAIDCPASLSDFPTLYQVKSAGPLRAF